MIIGIDIGGTKITGIVWDGKKIVEDITLPMSCNFPKFKEVLLKLAGQLSAGRRIKGIGIASAGYVNPVTGRLKLTGNAKFKADFNITKFFKSKFRMPIRIDNDANAFTRAEMLVGQGNNMKNFLGFILGTGMGGGIVINRKLYRGSEHRGAELGHIAAEQGFVVSPYQLPRDKHEFKQAGKVIGRTLAGLINIFAPEAIIIGGGFGHNEAAKYLPTAKAEMKKYLMSYAANSKVLVTKIKHAGAVGAALLF